MSTTPATRRVLVIDGPVALSGARRDAEESPVDETTEQVLPTRVRRAALYSHDTQGLGHIRRNIALAAALVAADPATNVLLLTGAPEATALPLPERTEVLTLPALAKDRRGGYSSRVLDAPLADVLQLRAAVMTAAIVSFGPDLVVVDKVARGVGGELDAVLRAVRAATSAKVVLGLRDVLDDPAAARAEWLRNSTTDVLAELYDAVWVYGDPDVYDPVAEYGLGAAVASMTSYTGYLGRGRGEGVRTRSRSQARVRPPRDPYLLCLVGGGQDGFHLAHAFLRARVPAGYEAVAVSGPYMSARSRQALREAAAANPGTRLLEFVPDAVEFVAGATAVVSMAGYNSVCEILASGHSSLLVPRVRPRLEQSVRAERLASRGLVDMLPPDRCTPAAISAWLARTVAVDRLRATGRVDLDGLSRVPLLARELVTGRCERVPACTGRASIARPVAREVAGVA